MKYLLSLAPAIALSLRQLLGDADFSPKGKRKHGVGDLVRYLADMGLDAKDISEIVGSPLTRRAFPKFESYQTALSSL